MKQSSAGFTGNSSGSLGGASQEDLKKGFSVVKDPDDDDKLDMTRFRARFGEWGDFNPEPDASIDRDHEKDWENRSEQ
jgi:hypothetical protein